MFFSSLYTDDIGFSKADLECLLQNDPAHKACREELRQLKDEFERYKANAQTMRKSMLQIDTDATGKNTQKLQNHIKDLKTTVESLQKELEDKDCELDILQERLTCEKVNLQKLHASELESERTIYRAKMQELEKQMQNQRSRTISLISEKDSEIERLKKKVATEPYSSSSAHKMYSARRPRSCDETVNELLLQSTTVRILLYTTCK